MRPDLMQYWPILVVALAAGGLQYQVYAMAGEAKDAEVQIQHLDDLLEDMRVKRAERAGQIELDLQRLRSEQAAQGAELNAKVDRLILLFEQQLRQQ